VHVARLYPLYIQGHQFPLCFGYHNTWACLLLNILLHSSLNLWLTADLFPMDILSSSLSVLLGPCGFIGDSHDHSNLFQLQVSNLPFELDSASLPFPIRLCVVDLLLLFYSYSEVSKSSYPYSEASMTSYLSELKHQIPPSNLEAST